MGMTLRTLEERALQVSCEFKGIWKTQDDEQLVVLHAVYPTIYSAIDAIIYVTNKSYRKLKNKRLRRVTQVFPKSSQEGFVVTAVDRRVWEQRIKGFAVRRVGIRAVEEGEFTMLKMNIEAYYARES